MEKDKIDLEEEVRKLIKWLEEEKESVDYLIS